MPTLIKNCGLKTPPAIACAIATGASFIGFVHHDPSPRHLNAAEIAALSSHVPPDVARVIVLVNPNDATLAALPKPSFWQITGVTTPARIADIHQRTGVPVITAIQVPPPIGGRLGGGLPQSVAYSTATGAQAPLPPSPRWGEEFLSRVHTLEAVSAHLLFDAYHATEAGGTGQAFDWSLLANIRPAKPWFLAGGLTPRNVAEAIARTRTPMVDVSSGIEDAPGIKSLEKIAAFNAAVLSS